MVYRMGDVVEVHPRITDGCYSPRNVFVHVTNIPGTFDVLKASMHAPKVYQGTETGTEQIRQSGWRIWFPDDAKAHLSAQYEANKSREITVDWSDFQNWLSRKSIIDGHNRKKDKLDRKVKDTDIKQPMVVLSVIHSGGHFLKNILNRCGEPYIHRHPETTDMGILKGGRCLVVMRDPASQYASCVRRYGVDWARDALPQWANLQACADQMSDVFTFYLEKPDYKGLQKWLGTRVHHNRWPKLPVNKSGPEPAKSQHCPNILRPFRHGYGYALR